MNPTPLAPRSGMPSPEPQLTPQERLTISRKALVKHMSRHRPVHEEPDFLDLQTDAPVSAPVPVGAWSLVKYGIRNWWQRHPASAVVDLARPLLEDYAHDHPFKLLGFSAGAGAAIVVLRPWRMVSAGVLLAALKSSGLSAALLSGLAQPQPPDRPPASR